MRKNTMRIFSAVLAAVVTAVSLFCSGNATKVNAKDIVPVVPPWLREENAGKWYNWDWQAGSGPAEEQRFVISVNETDGWKCVFNYSWASNLTYVDQAPEAEIYVDLNSTPVFRMNYSSDFTIKDFKLEVKNTDTGLIEDILIADYISSGSQTEFLTDLSKNDDILSLAKDGNIIVMGFKFDIDGLQEGQGVSIQLMQFEAASEEEIPSVSTIETDWLSPSNINNWWNWDWQHTGAEDGRFVIKADSEFWECTFNYSWASDLTYAAGNAFDIDIKKNPLLVLDSDSDFDFKVSLRVQNSNNEIEDIELVTVNYGERSTEFDLRTSSDILNIRDENDIISVTGIKITPLNLPEKGVLKLSGIKFKYSDKKVDLPEEGVTKPSWFSKENLGNWWNWDWQVGTGTPDEQRLTTSVTPDKAWQCVVKYSWASNITSSGPAVNVNIDDTPILDININSEFEYELQLFFGDGSEKEPVTINRFPAGSTVTQIDLRNIPEIVSRVDSSRKVRFGGVIFEPVNCSDNQKITVYGFRFIKSDAPQQVPDGTVYTKWFDSESLDNWWNWDWQAGSESGNRFTTNISDSVWQANINYDWVNRISTSGNPVYIDLTKTPCLYYAFSSGNYCNFKFTVTDGKGLQKEVSVNGTMRNGFSFGSVNLAENEELAECANNNILTIRSLVIEMEAVYAGDKLTVSRFLFDREGISFDDDSINLSRHDKETAQYVQEYIDTIGEVTLLNINRVEAARASYERLTGVQKAFVSNYSELTAAESEVAKLILTDQDFKSLFDTLPAERLINYMQVYKNMTVLLHMKNAVTLPDDILYAARQSDTTLELAVGGDFENPDYIFVIEPENITEDPADTETDIALSVSDKCSFTVNSGCALKINVRKIVKDTDTLYLYKYENGKNKLLESNISVTDSYAFVNIGTPDDYILTSAPL